MLMFALQRVGRIKILDTAALVRCLPNGSEWPHHPSIASRIKEKLSWGQTVKNVSSKLRYIALRDNEDQSNHSPDAATRDVGGN